MQLAWLEGAPAEHWWHAVVFDVRKGAAAAGQAIHEVKGPRPTVKIKDGAPNELQNMSNLIVALP